MMKMFVALAMKTVPANKLNAGVIVYFLVTTNAPHRGSTSTVPAKLLLTWSTELFVQYLAQMKAPSGMEIQTRFIPPISNVSVGALTVPLSVMIVHALLLHAQRFSPSMVNPAQVSFLEAVTD